MFSWKAYGPIEIRNSIIATAIVTGVLYISQQGFNRTFWGLLIIWLTLIIAGMQMVFIWRVHNEVIKKIDQAIEEEKQQKA